MRRRERGAGRPDRRPLGGDGRGGGRRGFTLIEVIGALVIFAVGVLMAASLSGSLSVQVQDAGVRAGVVTATQERMEAMERLAYDSFDVGSDVEGLTIQGRSYQRTTVVTAYGTRIRSVEVTVEPSEGSQGPSHRLLSYAYDPW